MNYDDGVDGDGDGDGEDGDGDVHAGTVNTRVGLKS